MLRALFLLPNAFLRSYYAGFALSVVKLALWSYNLVVFIFLRVLPLYFDKNKTPPVDMAYTVVPIPKTNAN